MTKLRSFLIKVCSLILGVCATVGVLTMANASSVSAADPLFMIYDAGAIRLNVGTEGYSGLRFRGYVNTEWYASQGIEGATFGTLIYPTKNGTVDTSKSSTENMNALDGNNVIWKYYNGNAFIISSIVFDDIVILNAIAEKYNTELGTSYTHESPEVIAKLGVVKAELYAMDFTAYPYAIANNKTYWTNTSYTTSMQKVAARTLVSIKDGKTEDEDGAIKKAALSYVGSWDEKYYGGYASVTDKEVVVDGIKNYQVSDDAIVVLGNENAIVKDGKIILDGEYTASTTPQKLYIFEEGSLKVIDLLLVDNVLKTAEDVSNYIDSTTWAEGENKFNEVTVLANDVDMSEVGTIYGGTTTKNFNGYFDGRGHVISNLTKATSITEKVEGKNVTTVYAPMLGDFQKTAVLKNLAFSELTSIGYNVNTGIISNNLRGSVENIYVKFSKESEMQQILMYTTEGTLTNAIIEAPYDDELDVDAKALSMLGHWGRTYFSRMINTSAMNNLFNVQVISQLPLITYGQAQGYHEPTYENDAVKWNTWFAYGENETDVWYDFDYFHNAESDTTAPGLGLAEGAQTVENTQVIVDGQSMKQGVTRVWSGVRRYNNIDEMLADTKNAENVQSYVDSGFWSLDDDGKLVWANGGVSKHLETYVGGDYEAFNNSFTSTAFNGEKIEKITVNGVELISGEGYTVDENGYLTSICAKTSDSDTASGVPYMINSANNTIAELIVETNACKYVFNNVNYWTRIIDSAEELKVVLDIDYTKVEGNTITRNAGNGFVYGNTSYTVTETINGTSQKVTYEYEVVYNAGIYKLNADIDMDGVTLDYSQLPLTNTNYYGLYYVNPVYLNGAFAGTFDGDGHVIDNFTPGKHGMFGVLGTIGSGLTTGANIKNVAFTNVLTKDVKANNWYPVIASYVYSGETVAQNISDVYVSYSEESTDMYGLVSTPTSKLYMKNVYVVNEKGYNAVNEEWKGQYLFADGTTLKEGKYYQNFFHPDNSGAHFGYTSSLFTSVYKLTDVASSYIDNVVVASPSSISYGVPISFVHSYLFSIDYGTRSIALEPNYPIRSSCFYNGKINGTTAECYICNGCGYAFATQTCGNGCENATFTKKAKVNSRFFKAQAYGANEETGNVPFPVDIAPQIKAEVSALPVVEDGVVTKNAIALLRTYSLKGYICDTCGKYVSLFNGTKCTYNGCTGTMSIKTSNSNTEYVAIGATDCGIWTSPLAYVWQFPDLTKISTASKIDNSNGVVKLAGVKRYDTVAEVTENVDFSGFTSKVWTIAEDGSLNWTSLYQAQA